jgi:hypothetical protein
VLLFVFRFCVDLYLPTVMNGGGIYMSDAQNVLLFECVVDSNSAPNGAGISIYGRSIALITNSRISSNLCMTGKGWGGGLFIQQNSRVTLRNSTLANNEALEYGGGFFVMESVLHFINCSVTANVARMYGGGGSVTIGTRSGDDKLLVVLNNTVLASNRYGSFVVTGRRFLCV